MGRVRWASLRQPTRAALLLAAAALALVALAGSADAATRDVTIQSSTFSPGTLSDLVVGDTVRWTNNDGFAHTSKASGIWDTGTIQGQGGSASVTMQTAGTFNYFCAIHPSMTGSVTVRTPTQNGQPSIVITSPPSGATVANTAVISGIASDPDPGDPLSVSLKIDNGQFRSVPHTGQNWNFSWDTRDMNNGLHTITVRVSDGALTTTSSITLTVNNVPSIEIVGPADAAKAKLGALIHITGRASAPQGSAITVQVSIDGAQWVNASGRTLWDYAWDTAGLLPGDHTFQARVIDTLNEILTDVRILTLEEPPPDLPPVLAIVSPGEGASVSGLVNISGTASDPDGQPTSVEVAVDGASWRPTTGRAGDTWWYHWIPEGRSSGAFTILARATAENVTVSVTRQATLIDSPTPLTITLDAAGTREGRPTVVRILSADTSKDPVPGARLYLAGADGATLHERATNSSGYAIFPGVPAGTYRLSAFASGASGSLIFDVKGLYDYNVTPTVVDFDRVTPVVVSVRSDGPVRGIDIELRGPILPGNVSGTVRTGSDGNAFVGLQPLAAGELAVYAAGNDTGLRVQIAPTVLVEWAPARPHPGDLITATFTFNDLARTPVSFTNVTIDAPGEARAELRTNGGGTLTLAPGHAGTLRLYVQRDGLRSVTHDLLVSAPPAVPLLSDLSTRAGPGTLQMTAIVTNVGEGVGIFTVDGLATSSAGTLAQQTLRTVDLAPGEQTRIVFSVNVGQGEYSVLISVRNSTAKISGTGQVSESGIPPTPAAPTQSVPVTPPQKEEEKKSPGAPAGLVIVLCLVAALSRRRQ